MSCVTVYVCGARHPTATPAAALMPLLLPVPAQHLLAGVATELEEGVGGVYDGAVGQGGIRDYKVLQCRAVQRRVVQQGPSRQQMSMRTSGNRTLMLVGAQLCVLPAVNVRSVAYKHQLHAQAGASATPYEPLTRA